MVKASRILDFSRSDRKGKGEQLAITQKRRGIRDVEEKRVTLTALKEELEELRRYSKAAGNERETKELMKNLHKELKAGKSEVAKQESLLLDATASLSKLKAILDLEKTKLEKLDPSSSTTLLGVEAQAEFDKSQAKLSSITRDHKISSDRVLALMEQMKEREREELKIKKQKEDNLLLIDQNKFEVKQIIEISLPQAKSKATSKESWTIEYEQARNTSKATKVELEKVQDVVGTLEFQVQVKNSKIEKAVRDYKENRLLEVFEISKILDTRKDEMKKIITSQEFVLACIKLNMEQIAIRNENLQEIQQIVTSGEVRIKQLNRRIINYESQIVDKLSTLSNLKSRMNTHSRHDTYRQLDSNLSSSTPQLSRFEIFKLEKELRSLAEEQSRLKGKVRREGVLQEGLMYDQSQLNIRVRKEESRRSELGHYSNLSRKDSEKAAELETKVRDLSMVLARNSDRSKATPSQPPKAKSSCNSRTGTPSFVVQGLIKTMNDMNEVLKVLRAENTELLLQMADMD